MLDWAKWLWGVLNDAFTHAPVLAGLLGAVLGMSTTEFVANFLSPTMDAHYAKRIVRLMVLGTTAVATFWLYPTPQGFVIALIAGMASPWLRDTFARALYIRWPALQPQALVPCYFDKPPPPSILPGKNP